jgi:hypothetical protein
VFFEPSDASIEAGLETTVLATSRIDIKDDIFSPEFCVCGADMEKDAVNV